MSGFLVCWKITSKAQISFKENLETSAQTTKAKGTKCPVCWKIREDKCERHGEIT